ncbi:MAG: methyltransferase [Ahrensia sp.]|nr:methyltransferase [Ahrensia sp.]
MTPNRNACEAFIRANTRLNAVPFVPEIKLHCADEAHDLWHKTQKELDQISLEPPFWAFAWAGGQGLARYLLDNPDIVAGKRVFDFASGSGLVAIAAKMAGAHAVTANDIDPFSVAACSLNASANNVDIAIKQTDIVGQNLSGYDILLAGDVFYDQHMAKTIWPWFKQLHENGIEVIIGDPSRAYVPKNQLQKRANYHIPVMRALEDADVKNTNVWALTLNA